VPNLLDVDAEALRQLCLRPPSGMTQLGNPPTDVPQQALVLAH
jgi:hypothetical protein